MLTLGRLAPHGDAALPRLRAAGQVRHLGRGAGRSLVVNLLERSHFERLVAVNLHAVRSAPLIVIKELMSTRPLT